MFATQQMTAPDNLSDFERMRILVQNEYGEMTNKQLYEWLILNKPDHKIRKNQKKEELLNLSALLLLDVVAGRVALVKTKKEEPTREPASFAELFAMRIQVQNEYGKMTNKQLYEWIRLNKKSYPQKIRKNQNKEELLNLIVLIKLW